MGPGGCGAESPGPATGRGAGLQGSKGKARGSGRNKGRRTWKGKRGRRHVHNKHVRYIHRARKRGSSPRLCLTAAALLHPRDLCWISRCQEVQNKRFSVLENQHHILPGSYDDNVSNSFSGIFFQFGLRSIRMDPSGSLWAGFQLFKIIRIYLCLCFIAKMSIWNFQKCSSHRNRNRLLTQSKHLIPWGFFNKKQCNQN